jgi:endonuclease/exonuclease/phosphatase family metal-dependent hydrolase
MYRVAKNLLKSVMRTGSKGRPLASAFTAAIVCSAALVAGVLPLRADEDDRPLRIMTQNMDPGSRLQEVAAAGNDPSKFLAAVQTTVVDILATKPAERAAALAREIAAHRPDLVGLQAAGILKTGTGPNTATVKEDQLAALIAALEALGEHYEVVGVLPNFDAVVNVPGLFVELTVHDAIIARTNPGEPNTRVLNVEVASFQQNISFMTPIGPFTNKRGWVLADVMVRGRAFRLATTHHDVNGALNGIELAQVKELIAKAGDTALPVVFAGDFNAAADVPPDPTHVVYQQLIDAGFVDGWKRLHPTDPGLTCCQDPSVPNSPSTLSARIDLVMLRGAIGIEDIAIVGNQPSDRSIPSGLWPSSHAGLAATLDLSGSRERDRN